MGQTLDYIQPNKIPGFVSLLDATSGRNQASHTCYKILEGFVSLLGT